MTDSVNDTHFDAVIVGSGFEYWPVTRAELDPHYNRVEKMLDARTSTDRLRLSSRALRGRRFGDARTDPPTPFTPFLEGPVEPGEGGHPCS